MSYADSVRQNEPATIQSRALTKPKVRFPVSAPLGTGNRKPVFSIPDEVFTASLAGYERNEFARLLRSRLGMGVADELLKRFQIGTSALWPGACVFWYIDEQDRKRGGQIKLFGKDFHTVKVSWAHTALAVRCQRQRVAAPDWLTDYAEHADKSPCLFGLTQLATAPADRPIAIVEAPKTAVLCTPYFPSFTWLAVGALSYLNAERLAPLRGRRVVLYPDLSKDGSAFQKWRSKAEELSREGFKIETWEYLEQHASPEQRAKGYDLADYLLSEWDGYPPSWNCAAPTGPEGTGTPGPGSVPVTPSAFPVYSVRMSKGG